jgi:hypothetical protein
MAVGKTLNYAVQLLSVSWNSTAAGEHLGEEPLYKVKLGHINPSVHELNSFLKNSSQRQKSQKKKIHFSLHPMS